MTAVLSRIHLAGEANRTACGVESGDALGVYPVKVTTRPIFVTCAACVETLSPEAWPTVVPSYFTSIKLDGLWSAPSDHESFEAALASIRGVGDPAVVMDGTTGETVWCNAAAEALGMATAYEAATGACPIHGEGCEAWR